MARVREQHPLLFPTVLRQANRTQIRVPIDDTHTYIVYEDFGAGFRRAASGQRRGAGPLPQAFQKSSRRAPPFTKFRLDEVDAQDFMAWETQGPILDRTRERLAGSDRGVVMYREMLAREIEGAAGSRSNERFSRSQPRDHRYPNGQVPRSREGGISALPRAAEGIGLFKTFQSFKPFKSFHRNRIQKIGRRERKSAKRDRPCYRLSILKLELSMSRCFVSSIFVTFSLTFAFYGNLTGAEPKLGQGQQKPAGESRRGGEERR